MLKGFFSKISSSLQLEHYYLFLALLFGGIMVFAMPPFQVMDEYNHFYKSYALSEGTIFCTKDMRGRPGMYLPEVIVEAGRLMGVTNLPYKNDLALIPENVSRTQDIHIKDEVRKFVEHPFCESPSWSSIPQALGIFLANLLHLPLLPLFYAGRLFNALTAIALIFLALKKLPFGKSVFMFIALLPMFMQQVSSYSLDALHYSLLFLFYSVTLAFAYGSTEKLSKKSLLFYTLFSFIAIHAKIGFFPLILLVFLIPKEKFASPLFYYLYGGLMTLMHLLFFMAMRTIFSIGDYSTVGLINRDKQLHFVLTHPLEFLKIIGDSINTFFDFYWKNIMGILGWMDYQLYNIHYLLLIVFLWILLSNKEESSPLKGKDRWFLFGIFSISSILLFVILYALDNAIGSPLVTLMQGKYLLPLLPLFFLSIYQIRLSKKHLHLFFIGITCLSIIGTYSALQNRYYHTKTTDLWDSSSGTLIKEITPSEQAYQTFLATEDNLKSISIYVPTFEKKVDSVIKVILRDKSCTQVISAREISPDLIRARGYYTVDFPLQPHSKNSTYCVHIYPNESFAMIPFPIEVSEEDRYKEGSLKLGKNYQKGDILMKIHYAK